MDSTTEKILVKIRNCDFEIEDHGLPILNCTFEADHFCIGLGYQVDIAFLMGFLEAVGAVSLRTSIGKSCWISLKSPNGPVIKIHPLYKKDGKIFDIEKWSDWIKKHSDYSKFAYELRKVLK